MNLQDKSKLYSIFRIKKPNGKTRVIMAPCEELKSAQKKLAERLNKITLSDHCYGFRKGFSVSDAVQQHMNKDWILKVDIKNFFPSITIDKLTFLSEREREIATLEGRLVQGSPSSPVISNIVFRRIDNILGKYFSSLDISYTRYADDILISGIGDYDKRYIKFITNVIGFHQYVVNDKKVKLMFKSDRMDALGVTLNKDIPSCNRVKRRNIRATIHKEQETNRELGYLSYVRSINLQQYDKLMTGLLIRQS